MTAYSAPPCAERTAVADLAPSRGRDTPARCSGVPVATELTPVRFDWVEKHNTKKNKKKNSKTQKLKQPPKKRRQTLPKQKNTKQGKYGCVSPPPLLWISLSPCSALSDLFEHAATKGCRERQKKELPERKACWPTGVYACC